MIPFTTLTGVAAPLPIDNVDTDAIIPSRETQSVARTGYGEKLFANWRYTPGTRIMNPDFVLNRPPYDGAVALVEGMNFGCCSSREAAVWSLAQFGIRAIVAKSYGAIFFNNCIRNGLLPITLEPQQVEALLARIDRTGGREPLKIDLQAQRVGMSDDDFTFAIAPHEKEMLLSGADEIELTLRRRAEIEAFRARDRAARPWLYTEAVAAR